MCNVFLRCGLLYGKYLISSNSFVSVLFFKEDKKNSPVQYFIILLYPTDGWFHGGRHSSVCSAVQPSVFWL